MNCSAMLARLILVFGFFIAISCHRQDSPKQELPDEGLAKESLLNANKQLLTSEEEQIDGYIHRYGWEMQRTGSGLRYMIYELGNGIKSVAGMTARFEYTLSLLNGDVIYSSGKDGLKEVVIGTSDTETGLSEGLLLLHQGDGAKFILPSHLAFGLLGDGREIPSKAALVYDVKLVSLNE